MYDIVGIGFGPANLALAIAIEEYNRTAAEEDRLHALFLEQKPEFRWHDGMLIEGTTMQVSFLKDLVTIRNPASTYSFLSYLHEKDRLVDFINHKTMFPSRIEFHDYLSWAAGRLAHLVRYGTTAVEVDAEGSGFTVRARRGDQLVTYRGRNVVLGLGLEPKVPDGVQLGERVWHNYDLLERIEELRGQQPRRFTVVGAGQSAAEVTDYLHRSFPDSEVCAVFRRYGYCPADDSPFANRIFDPAAVDDFYASPAEVKQMLMDYHGNTNYSVVDLELIEELYARLYQEKVQGKQRLRIFNASQVDCVEQTGDGVRVSVQFLPTGKRTELDSDVLIYATGYRPRDLTGLLGRIAQDCCRGADGQLEVERDYRVRTTTDLPGGIYLQGGTEHTHGITSSLLSNGAVRAGEIRDSVLARRGSELTPEPALR
ncbi:MAG: lysine N(6)-hydroxylase/L-ornithine N(5)-oxygenase family protein [Saccharopolyspora rectivirgula]|uniref:lysine N(6)-hydroxylase/L-ornithine N(5)-oxygenase family protein n=1 Tax=Saccharopolyspora rectivirgula TaxID=28042 RepID=UPI00240991E2|nr:lysine N(6)-hydroxylase/L-ornithine N(5)-oxygenase family protein [Saccharopolyspora rectivirgula]